MQKAYRARLGRVVFSESITGCTASGCLMTHRNQSADFFFRLAAGTRVVLALVAGALRGRLAAARRGFLAGLS